MEERPYCDNPSPKRGDAEADPIPADDYLTSILFFMFLCGMSQEASDRFPHFPSAPSPRKKQ
jgi:hypothetical protein